MALLVYLDEVLKSADPQQLRHRSFQAISDLAIALSRKQPLVLVFEDVHWAGRPQAGTPAGGSYRTYVYRQSFRKDHACGD